MAQCMAPFFIAALESGGAGCPQGVVGSRGAGWGLGKEIPSPLTDCRVWSRGTRAATLLLVCDGLVIHLVISWALPHLWSHRADCHFPAS